MKKATVYFTETCKRLDEQRNRKLTINVQDDLFNSWDWDGIAKVFRCEAKPFRYSDSTIRITRIKLGNAILQGSSLI